MPDGPLGDCYRIASELGSFVGALIEASFGGLVGGGRAFLTCVDEIAMQCEVCRAFGKAPGASAAGNSAVAMFNGKLQGANRFSTISLQCML